MKRTKILHSSITQERVMEAVESQMYGLENPGFCLNCGADHDSCEPDAQGYECYECGKHTVCGAAEILMYF